MNDTRREYLKRINSVLNFIEKNLDAELSLEYLAKKAHYSPYHFHRVFLTVVNEKLNEYINRKRIERIAAVLLIKPKTALSELAFKYGFNSGNSFSRAFKKYYGVSPTQFKSEGKQLLSKIGIDPFSSEQYICSIDNLKQWIGMNVKITVKELPVLLLASISNIGAFDKAESMFQRLMKWGHQKAVIDRSNFKAIMLYHDNPNVTDPSKLRYSACVTINKNIEPDGDIRQLDIQKGIYAVGHLEIKAEDISNAWRNMCIWIIENGYEFRDGEYFEMYHNDHKTHPEQKFIVDICIPLVNTSKLKSEEIISVNFPSDMNHISNIETGLDYHQLINYMKELKAYFQKEYDTQFNIGSINQSSSDFTYFSLTPEELKKQKLKFVLILNHKLMQFEICLSGQNKSIRKQYWEIFRDSDWNKYHIAESINTSLMIVDHVLVQNPDFGNTQKLTEQIETEAIRFINEIRALLE